jgi:hypothetical protein|tara:strand:- start:23 stop:544 length:522 start_codon:yes stop_codon:yes gene_type:complete
VVKKKGLDRLQFGLLESAQQIDNKVKDRLDEEYQRMLSVAGSFGFGTTDIDWYQVALKLAKEFVPELKENKPRGPKLKWGMFEKMMLAGEIYRLKITGLTIEQACEELCKADVWQDFLDQKENTYGSDAKAALLKQYSSNSRESIIGMHAYLHHVQTDDLDGWQKVLNEIKKK